MKKQSLTVATSALLFLCLELQALPLKFAWDANTDAKTVGYRLMGVKDNGVATVLFSASGINTTNASVDVAPGSWAFYCLAFGTDGSESDPSNIVTFQASVAPALVVNAPSITYIGGQRWSVSLSWQPSPASYGVTNYAGSLMTSGGTVVTTFSGPNTSATFPNLAAGSYSFQVWPLNASGAGAATVRTFALTKPGNPKNFRLVP